MQSQARVVLHPILSSPRQLSLGAFGVTLVVYAIQLTSGVPPWLTWSPVELSSNVVAAAGLAWAMIQLRASWGDRASRFAWGAASAGMALLVIEGDVGELFLLEIHGREEMSLSIAIWLVAACLLFSTSRRFAMRRSVEATTRCAFAIQVAAQITGFWAATLAHPEGDLLEYMTDTGELVAVLAYLIALLLAVFSPDKSYRFPLHAIGRKTRDVVRDFKLKSSSARPASAGAVLRRGAALASFARCWGRVSHRVHRDGGPSPARQLRELIHVGLIGRVDPRTYYRLKLFGEPAAADGVMTSETGFGLAAALRGARSGLGAASSLDDRVAFAAIAQAHGLPVAPILATVSGGRLHAALGDWGGLDRDFVATPRLACAPDPDLAFTRVAPMIFGDGSGNVLNIDMVASRLGGASLAGDLVLLPRLQNHELIAAFARSSAIDFQVVSGLDPSGEPHVTHGALRIRATPVADAEGPAAEWGAPIDLATGVFGSLSGDGIDGSPERRYAHPVTREMISGRACAGWREIARTATAAHRVFDQDAAVCWTIVWTPEGPCILKGDPHLDFGFVERCYGAPIGRSPLAPLLDWRIDQAIGQGPFDADGGTSRLRAGSL